MEGEVGGTATPEGRRRGDGCTEILVDRAPGVRPGSRGWNSLSRGNLRSRSSNVNNPIVTIRCRYYPIADRFSSGDNSVNFDVVGTVGIWGCSMSYMSFIGTSTRKLNHRRANSLWRTSVSFRSNRPFFRLWSTSFRSSPTAEDARRRKKWWLRNMSSNDNRGPRGDRDHRPGRAGKWSLRALRLPDGSEGLRGRTTNTNPQTGEPGGGRGKDRTGGPCPSSRSPPAGGRSGGYACYVRRRPDDDSCPRGLRPGNRRSSGPTAGGSGNMRCLRQENYEGPCRARWGSGGTPLWSDDFDRRDYLHNHPLSYI